MCPLAMFVNYRKLASSQSNRHKYRLLQDHRVICWHIALWNMDSYGVYNFVDSWSEKTTECEYECECLFLIFVHANANSKKTCEYSHLRMRMQIFGPSLIGTTHEIDGQDMIYFHG